MPYSLRYFSDFITEHFSASLPSRSKTSYDHAQHQLFEHAKHCKNQFISDILSCTTDRQLALRVRNEQILLIELMDKLDRAINFGPDHDMYCISEGDALINLAKHLYMILAESIHYLFTYHPAGFDPALRLPDLYRMVRARELGQDLGAFQYAFYNAGVGEEISDIVKQAFSVLQQNHTGIKPAFHHYFFLTRLSADMGALLAQKRPDLSDRLMDLLITHDFNTPEFYDYCIKYFTACLRSKTTTAGKKQLLEALSARLHRCLSSATPWHTNKPSLKHSLLPWMKEQFGMLESERSPPEGPVSASHIASPKVNTIMNVPQMAHMLRLMIETGVYIGIPPVDAIRFQSNSFTAPQSKNISPESMRQRYYTPDTPTAAAVRELLRKMIAHSKKLSP